MPESSDLAVYTDPANPLNLSAAEVERLRLKDNWLWRDYGKSNPCPIKHIDSPVPNPYWDIVREMDGDPIGGWDGGWEIEGYRSMHLLRAREVGHPAGEAEVRSRDALVRDYSWSVPDPVTLHFVHKYLNERSVVEIGAGTGYWAKLLTLLGHEVVAFDKDPVENNSWHSPSEWTKDAAGNNVRRFLGPSKNYYPINRGGPEVLAGEAWKERTPLWGHSAD